MRKLRNAARESAFGALSVFSTKLRALRRQNVEVPRAALSVVHEMLEPRIFFSGTSSEEYLVSTIARKITADPVYVEPTHPELRATSQSDLLSQLNSLGLTVTDTGGELGTVTSTSIVPASDLPPALANSIGLAPDQFVAVVNYSGGAYPYDSGSTLYFPITVTQDQDNNDCGCDNNVNPDYTQAPDDCLCGDLADAAGDAQDGTVISYGGASEQPDGETNAPVYYSDGVVNESETDLSSNGFGSPWGITRDWTNNLESAQEVDALNPSEPYIPGDPTTDVFGNNVVENQLGRAIANEDQDDNNSIGISTNGNDITWFDETDGSYAPRFYDNGSLTVNSGDTEIDYTDEAGQVSEFYGFSSSIPVAQQGQFKLFNSAQGISTGTTYNSSNGLLESVSRSYTDVAGLTSTETYAYSYTSISSGTPIYRVSQIQLERTTSASVNVDYVQTVQYTYYSSTDNTYGNWGDLETATTYDGQGPSDSNPLNRNSSNTDYYRYYTPDDYFTGGYVGGLKFVFTGANYARLTQNLEAMTGDAKPDDAGDSSVADYANYQYTYNGDERISSEVVAGAGGTELGGGVNTDLPDDVTSGAGLGVYTYQYNTSNNTVGSNSWATQTIVTQPNGEAEIVYTNAFGEVMMDIQDADDSSGISPSDAVRITDYQYNDSGQVTQVTQPAAFQKIDGVSYDDSNADPSTGFISTTNGLIEKVNYYNSSSASLTSSGGVINYEQDITDQQGSGGSAQEQESWSYIAHNYSGGATVYALATDTTYGLANGYDPRTTSYSYNWFSVTNAISSSTTTVPQISTADNGSNSSNAALVAYNNLGMVVWTENANGNVAYTNYNIATGAITTHVTDVAFTDTVIKRSPSLSMVSP
jgi:hypothetical protein